VHRAPKKQQKALIVVPKKKKRRQVVQVAPASRSLVDTAIKTVGSAVMTGNVPRALLYGAYDAAQVLAKQYLNRAPTVAKPMSIGTVSVPLAKQMKLKGSMQGVWSGVTHIEKTPDGMLIHQRVYVGEVIAAITTGNVYLYDSTLTYSTYIGQASNSTTALNTAPVFPVVAGGPLNTNATPYSTLWKQEYFFPNNLLVTQLAASFEYWRPEQFNIQYVPTCPTSTAGNLAIAWTPSSPEEFNVTSGSSYMGASNSFLNMSQCPYFVSTPVWQSAGLSNIQPMIHGSAQGGNGWIRCKMLESSSTNIDSNKAPHITAGCIIFNVLDNAASLTSSVPLGHVFADYVYCFKGQHSLYNQSSVYYTLTRSLSTTLLSLLQAISSDIDKLLDTPRECKNVGTVAKVLDLDKSTVDSLIRQIKANVCPTPQEWEDVKVATLRSAVKL
jgi:hypothetical protein